MTLRVRCPRCDAEVVADESKPLPAGFPFCSERCSYSDLGKWFDEEYRVSRTLRPGEEGEPPSD